MACTWPGKGTRRLCSWVELGIGRSVFAPALSITVLLGMPAWGNEGLLEYLGSQPSEKRVPREYTEEEVENWIPLWPNPYLALLPAGAQPDLDFWRAKARFAGRARRQEMEAAAALSPSALAAPLEVNEVEPNDSAATANFLGGFGTRDGDLHEATVSGSLGAPAPSPVGPFAEDEGSIPLAGEIDLARGESVIASGVIGDGPFGSSGAGSGDFDFFRLADLAAGDDVFVDVDTPVPFGPLDPFVVLYDAAGDVVAFNDDDLESLDSFLEVSVPAAGDYFVSIGGSASFVLADPFDSSSGRGAGSEGSYEVVIGLRAGVADFFSFDLEAGDILGASLSGAGVRLRLFDPAGELRVGSRQDLSFLYPAASPLPGGGNGALSYVIEEAGTWAISVTGGSGDYALDLLAETAALRDVQGGAVQRLFVDFDGATVDLAQFGGPPEHRSLSPLSTFLSRWGLDAADEDAVIDAILDTVEENISSDMRLLGSNGDFDASGSAGEFDVEILNSRDHPDPFGDPHTSRIVVGGSVFEFGFSTIGIAQSIDVGNFETSEDAVVLLDILSRPAGELSSLNSIPIGGGATIIDLIGAAVGNIVAHEAGHYSGNFHTEQFFTLPNVMDKGGNLPNIIGVGPDGRFGTGDDFDVDFGRDIYVPTEGFAGTEDTLDSVAFGLATPVLARQVGVDVDPGQEPGTVNTVSNGLIQVALLASASFDVADIDLATLAFGPAGAAPQDDGKLMDVDGDGSQDRVFKVRVRETGLAAGDVELCVAGSVTDGPRFEGCDPVTTLPRSCGFGTPGGAGPVFQPAGPANGGFEDGSFDGWILLEGGLGAIAIDDGSFVPPGPGASLPPFEGAFAAATWQTGPGLHTLHTDVTLEADLVEARLAWADHLQNNAGVFEDPIQEWRVEVWDPSDGSILAELFSTEPGDPAFQDWTEREADLTPWIGQTIRIAFTERDRLSFFNARFDAVKVWTRRRLDVEVDVRPGNAFNSLNPISQGVVPVALLGSPDLDVADVDALTLGFGPGGSRPAHDICRPELFETHLGDVDADGDDDLLVHFRVPGSGIAFGAAEACVVGGTSNGDEIRGCDAIVTVPACGIGFELVLLLPLLMGARRGVRS